MDKIEKIRQEIKRRHDYENEMYHKKKPDGRPNDGWAESLAIMGVLEELLTFLDTLLVEPDNDASLESSASYDTQKYAPRPSVDIEDVARVQFASHVKVFDKKRKAVFDWEQFKEVAGIFYSFGKKDSKAKEKEQPDKNLEEAAEEWCKINNKGIALCADKKSHYLAEGVDAFIAVAEWQKEQDQPITGNSLEQEWLRYVDKKKKECGGELPFLGEYGWLQIARHFAKWQKEQMLKDAVEGVVCATITGTNAISFLSPLPKELTVGDKVRIVILKQKEE